jgi:hypothetical protein
LIISVEQPGHIVSPRGEAEMFEREAARGYGFAVGWERQMIAAVVVGKSESRSLGGISKRGGRSVALSTAESLAHRTPSLRWPLQASAGLGRVGLKPHDCSRRRRCSVLEDSFLPAAEYDRAQAQFVTQFGNRHLALQGPPGWQPPV